MRKQYIFLLLIIVMLYSIFLISTYKYKEYKVNIHINSIAELIEGIKSDINNTLSLIEYKKSLAYRNKVLKEEQGLKNKGEVVIYLTPEKKYNKFIKEKSNEENIEKKVIILEDDTTEYMTIFEKWIYYLK